MTTFTVTTAADVVANDGELSLREAVAKANATAAADTIEFDAVLEGTTLLLTGGELALSQDVTIDGDRTMTAARSRSAPAAPADPAHQRRRHGRRAARIWP